MLLEIVGALVGFVALILLLSLIVTALVQFSQSLLRLRGRNLRSGLRQLIDMALDVERDKHRKAVATASAAGQPPPAPLELPSAGDLANRIAGTKHLLPLLGRTPPVPWLALVGPVRNWIQRDELREILSSPESGVPQRTAAVVDSLFERWEKMSFGNYQFMMRVSAMVWGFLVAFLFQVNSPAVLRRLANDADMRKEYNAVADALVGRAGESIEAMVPYEDVSSLALESIAAQYPGLSGKLEEASGRGEVKADMLSELSIVLDGEPNRSEVIAAYSKALDELHAEESAKIEDVLSTSLGDLERMDVRLWGHGYRFYWDGGVVWRNVIGVLITTALLAFGAPFWFERLKEMARLRDALTPKAK